MKGWQCECSFSKTFDVVIKVWSVFRRCLLWNSSESSDILIFSWLSSVTLHQCLDAALIKSLQLPPRSSLIIHITVQWTKTKHIQVKQQKKSTDLPLSKSNIIQTYKYFDITNIKVSPWVVISVDTVTCLMEEKIKKNSSWYKGILC